MERRYAGGKADQLRPLAEELVRLKVEMILTWGTDGALAAKSATTTIPIVMLSVGDPVRAGLIASLARPGGNITGYSLAGPEVSEKLLSLLRELLPGLHSVGVLEYPDNPYYRAVRHDFEQACKSVGMQPIIVEVAVASELANAISEIVRRQAKVLVVPDEDLFIENRASLMSDALKRGLPIVTESREILQAGALALYGPSLAEKRERNAAFVDRILRGAKPADLPIEQPTRFDLVINLKAAKALGITIPPHCSFGLTRYFGNERSVGTWAIAREERLTARSFGGYSMACVERYLMPVTPSTV